MKVKRGNKAVGFTGTQRGMSMSQAVMLRQVLVTLWESNYRIFHHGDCIGADHEAHITAKLIGYHIIIHPSVINTMRAKCIGDEIYAPKPPLDRNRDIVDASIIMIAAPKTDDEILRSGTWATVRYARRTGKTIIRLER